MEWYHDGFSQEHAKHTQMMAQVLKDTGTIDMSQEL